MWPCVLISERDGENGGGGGNSRCSGGHRWFCCLLVRHNKQSVFVLCVSTIARKRRRQFGVYEIRMRRTDLISQHGRTIESIINNQNLGVGVGFELTENWEGEIEIFPCIVRVLKGRETDN